MCSVTSVVGAASTLELVEMTASIAAELARREGPESGPAAVQVAEMLGQAMDVLEAALAIVVGRVDDTGAFGELGFSSTGAWLRGRLGMRDGRAGERVRLARQLPRLKQVAQRLAAGSLSAGYAGAIADAVARLDDLDTELGERLLLGLADQGHTAAQVAKDGAQITDLINTHRGKEKEPDDSRRGFSRSWATKSKSLDGGLWLRAWLTPEHAAAFEQIIGPLAKPKARGDDRDLGQRTADALMSVITQGNKGAGVTVIIDLAAFTQATGDTGPFDRTPHASGTHTQPSPSGNHQARTQARTQAKGPASEPAPGHPRSPATMAGKPGRSRPDGMAATLGDTTSGRGADPPGDRGFTGQPPTPSGHRETTHHDEHRAQDGEGIQPSARNENAGNQSAGHANRDGGDGDGDRSVIAEARAWEPGGAGEHVRGRVAARLLNGTAISPERARQIALNAGINVLVLGRGGLPLYLGRTVRFATPAQRKTLLALYDTCCVQGCQIPAHLSEIHHLHGGWKLGTPTDINKLVPACGWHNRWIEAHPDQVEQIHDAQGRTSLRLLAPWERATSQAA